MGGFASFRVGSGVVLFILYNTMNYIMYLCHPNSIFCLLLFFLSPKFTRNGPFVLQVFRFGTKDGKPADHLVKSHSYILQPVTGNAKYTKLRPNDSVDSAQPLQKAAVNLDDVTLCLSKVYFDFLTFNAEREDFQMVLITFNISIYSQNGYCDILKLADNFAAFNQRLKYAHYRPPVSVKSDPRSWWKYAFKAVSDQMKKAR